ncbi:MAG: hypothetical protein KBA02_00115 [Paludibacteraceae bacterium]|nr:hypothetical protein [Paludibacteraceae bacterium]
MSLILDNLAKYNQLMGKMQDSTSQGFITLNGVTMPNNFMWTLFNLPLLSIQATALSEGSGFASSVMTSIYARVYVKNDSGSNVTIDYPETLAISIGGFPVYNKGSVTLSDGVTYAMHPETAKWIIEKAAEEDVELDYVDQTEWFSTGSSMVFGS